MDIFVIMGAAVRQDGTPSGAMRRRIVGALTLGKGSPDPFYLVTGGVGRWGPSEAEVMKAELLAAGVPENQIATEDASNDTLSSIVNCTLIIREQGADSVSVCSDRYHIVRCRWLFCLLGIATRPVNMPSGRSANGLLRWIFYYVRECIAMPVDTFLMILYRLRHGGIATA
jgi:vancomycin permeability regulator SanA